jgi:sporulation protein YlmC with PRC-barrel domain
MNKTNKIMIVLASVFCFVFLGSNAFSQDYSEVSPYERMEAAAYSPTGWYRYEASWLIGHHVMTPQSGDLGQIESLVIDRTNGRVALVVLSDVPYLQGERLAIPFSSIKRIGPDTFEFNPGDMNVEVAPGWADPYIYTVTQHHFYGFPETMDAAWLTEVYRDYGQAPYWTESSMSLEFYESSDLVGAEVRLSQGETTGRINDLVIDSSDGRIAFVVLSDVAGRGDTLVAVPFSFLSSRSGNLFTLDISQDQLASAPSFNEFADLSNPRWAGDVYIFFGLSPYWSEREEMRTIPEESEGMEFTPNTMEWNQMHGF